MRAARTPLRGGRAELLRALGAYCAAQSVAAPALTAALGVAPLDAESHTRAFVLGLPPYASIHLGAEGMLGGEAADRVAGFYRALDLPPPAEPDHLATLLGLAAHLRDAEAACVTEAGRARARHARSVLVFEHVSSWVAGYLAAVEHDAVATDWARLCAEVLVAERTELAADGAPAGARLPRALAEAPAPLADEPDRDELLDALVAPVRVGFVLSGAHLAEIADGVGAGLRRGERRFALRSLLDQEAGATLRALADTARRAAARHRPARELSGDAAATWWSTRAADSATVLAALGARAGGGRAPDAA